MEWINLPCIHSLGCDDASICWDVMFYFDHWIITAGRPKPPCVPPALTHTADLLSSPSRRGRRHRQDSGRRATGVGKVQPGQSRGGTFQGHRAPVAQFAPDVGFGKLALGDGLCDVPSIL